MLPGKFVWKPFLKKALTGHFSSFHMVPQETAWPKDLVSPGLYLHVPFCKNLCPYCPYNRVEYNERLFDLYEAAVKKEIDLYAPFLKGYEFTSLYIGGGTPTVNPQGLLRILSYLKQSLAVHCDICIELHPANMDDDCLQSLRDLGVNIISIGVESTSDTLLSSLGRSHDGPTAKDAVKRAVRNGFQSLNVDLMFALPGQTLDDWKTDVDAMLDLGVDQISTYPLFSFPYSELGVSQGITSVTRPSEKIVKQMLDYTHKKCIDSGLERCAVWSWLRPKKFKFSSITRHHYIGFGPSAASMTGDSFFVNTFDVEAYSQRLNEGRPIALTMPVDKRLEMAYWLYWRVYELGIKNTSFKKTFGPSANIDKEFGFFFNPLRAMGMVKKTGDGYQINDSGAYWIHRLQNEYSLSYINNLWGSCRKNPWPQEARL